MPQLSVGESFTAGDFQVVATEVHGGNGYFTGRGHTRLPYLSNIKLAVHFTNILVNTDRQLAQGTVITAFDPTMRNIVNTGEVVQTVGEFGEAVGDLWDEIFKEKEKLLDELAEAETLEEQQEVITKINTYEFSTVAQEIDQIEGKENLPQELQQELDTIRMEGNLATTQMLSPQEIADISTADGRRRDRIKEIAAIAGEDFVIFGDKMVHHIMAIVNGYWCAKNEGASNYEYFYGKGWSFFDFKGNLDQLGLNDLVVKFKKKNENHGKKLVATEYTQETTKIFEGNELEYEGYCLTFNTTDRITQGSNSLQLCFKNTDARNTFENTFLTAPPTGNELYYTNLTSELNTKMASKKYDDAHLLLTMVPKCEVETFSNSQRVSLINSLLDETTTDGLQEQLIIRLLEEYEDTNILVQANLYRQLDLESLFESVDGAESDLLTFTINDMMERYRAVAEVPYGGTVAMQEISTGNIFTRYNISKNTEGSVKLTLDTNAAGYNASYHYSEVVVPYTDIFSIFTVEGEALEIPFLLLLKGVVKKEEERTFRQMMMAVDVASLAFGVAEFKLAFTATSNLARAFRIALGSADIMATAADVACNGEDDKLCEDWQKVSGWVQLGLISATGADLLYQTLKRSTKLQDEVLRLGGLADAGNNLLSAFKSRLSSRLTHYSGFTLTHSDAEIIAIIQKGKTLSLSDEVIDDFLLISCRNSKAISSSELIVQMDNWVNVVKQRGFPYRFNSLGEFNQFSNDLKNGLNSIGLPINDVRIQGSSLRTPNASDLDLVAFIDDVSFNNFLKSAFGTNQIKKNGMNIDVTQMSDIELSQLASDIDADISRTIFNSKSRTFANSFATRKISAKSTTPELVSGLNGLKNTISGQYSGLNIEDISIMTTGGNLDLKPFIKL
ncbi:MAG: hypothetical protein ACX93O_09985 [Flagellimonas sp.]